MNGCHGGRACSGRIVAGQNSASPENALARICEDALSTGTASLSIPCDMERRHGGVADDELLMAVTRRFGEGEYQLRGLPKAESRYLILAYNTIVDSSRGMSRCYAAKAE